ncbi:MAG: ATP synthase gamma chain [Parcubacteria group bacterium GW2011_GWA2_40_8]|uniref:ATP synthase gamma chain n=1 Tax=Candidatus Terrybacteria bacterium RIFCSPLOWO2_01_FULL_40_23 TaxID=1802366 RepID=A0A1G2PUB7_9BACT|nr:MAG: ATP synthase gamma chain [Parcubacteria group bacterium GW2011_GWB1_40_14]KKR79200.1 MAG: ATP synthase gamma chain [Parcubacteria group bacterium GW2011_GWA2_40_8]OHA51934.1 MAG: ATP synthase F1 subunit gamma [Candidatus Terrybacteria bacterium RIFCSPLOWO2_01_FULL_40_23]
MAQNTRELRRRIKSTKSIRQITKAMEMIAASKMRKAQLAALSSRPYSVLAWEMLSSVAEKSEQFAGADAELFYKFLSRGIKVNLNKELIILITSNRGLCGSLNSQLVNAAFSIVKNNKDTFDELSASKYSFIIVGRKGLRSALRLGLDVFASYDGFENQPTFADTLPIARSVMDSFAGGQFKSVKLIYADFISTLKYEIRVTQLLPINIGDESVETKHAEFLFEPSPAEVLNSLIPRLIELQVYQALVENLASEHSARMVNMKNASDSARDIINDLTLTYNSVRQASITADLADIIGGRMAVK